MSLSSETIDNEREQVVKKVRVPALGQIHLIGSYTIRRQTDVYMTTK